MEDDWFAPVMVVLIVLATAAGCYFGMRYGIVRLSDVDQRHGRVPWCWQIPDSRETRALARPASLCDVAGEPGTSPA